MYKNINNVHEVIIQCVPHYKIYWLISIRDNRSKYTIANIDKRSQGLFFKCHLILFMFPHAVRYGMLNKRIMFTIWINR